MTNIRLNKYLSDSGICSRRKADEHILAGDVKVNNVVAKLGAKIDPSSDEIRFNDEIVKSREDLVYYAVYKPKGIISTASDELDRKSVTDLVPKSPRVYPVGRLDKDSEGLIILTNDGELTNLLTHPKNEHEKEYEVEASVSKYKICDSEEIQRQFLNGLEIEGKLMKADSVKISLIHDTKCLIQIVIHTGYNRQIRKMCDKMGLTVLKLTRIRIAKLTLNKIGLKPAEYKAIGKEDIV